MASPAPVLPAYRAVASAADEEEDEDAEDASSRPLLNAAAAATGLRRRARSGHVTKALFYGAQVFYSFFIMLLFMTYNGWVMIACAVGASLGYLVWGGRAEGEGEGKSVACH